MQVSSEVLQALPDLRMGCKVDAKGCVAHIGYKILNRASDTEIPAVDLFTGVAFSMTHRMTLR